MAVTVAAGVPSGIELDWRVRAREIPLTFTLSPQVAPDVIAWAAVDEFGLGLEEESRTVVDIALAGTLAPSSGHFCLPVAAGLREAVGSVRFCCVTTAAPGRGSRERGRPAA